MNVEAPIGVFDSGVGGLTVVKEIMEQIPNERIVYFGDTARVPYGSKSKDTIIKYSKQIIRFLQKEGVKAIVIACNTASAFALEEVRKEFDLPIIGVIESGAREASVTTRNKRVGVIGTEGTVNSRMYNEVLKSINPDITVLTKACPLFVPLVEEGFKDDPITIEVVKKYLADLKEENIDTLVLGCTHYPLLRETIAKVMGVDVTLVNPAYETAIELKNLLTQNNLANKKETEERSKMYKFYVSDAAKKFEHFADSILPFEIPEAKQISVDEQYDK